MKKTTWKPAALVAGGAIIAAGLAIGTTAMLNQGPSLEGALASCGVTNDQARFFQGDLLGTQTTQISMRERAAGSDPTVPADAQMCVLEHIGVPEGDRILIEAVPEALGLQEADYGDIHLMWSRNESHGLEVTAYRDQR